MLCLNCVELSKAIQAAWNHMRTVLSKKWTMHSMQPWNITDSQVSILFPLLVSRVVTNLSQLNLSFYIACFHLTNFTTVPTSQSVGGSGISGPTACILGSRKQKWSKPVSLQLFGESLEAKTDPKIHQKIHQKPEDLLRPLDFCRAFVATGSLQPVHSEEPTWRRKDMSREMISWDPKNLETMLKDRSFLVCMQFSPLFPQIPQ